MGERVATLIFGCETAVWLQRWGELKGNEGKRSRRRRKRINSWWQNHGCAPSAAQLRTANQSPPSACAGSIKWLHLHLLHKYKMRPDAQMPRTRVAGRRERGVTRVRCLSCRRAHSCSCRLAAVIRFFFFLLSSESKLKGDEACSLSSVVFSCFAAISHFSFKPCPLFSLSGGAVTS